MDQPNCKKHNRPLEIRAMARGKNPDAFHYVVCPECMAERASKKTPSPPGRKEDTPATKTIPARRSLGERFGFKH